MPQITKNKQPIETIQTILRTAFGPTAEIRACRELSDGFCNVTYDIELTDGRTCILKVGQAGNIKMMSCEAKMMPAEVSAMRCAAAHGMPGIAEVYYYDRSRTICTGEYFLMEKVDGVNLAHIGRELSQEQKENYSRQTGQFLKQLHQIRGDKFGHFCEPLLQYDSWYEAFYGSVAGIIEDGKAVNIDIGISYDEILKLLEKHREYFAEVTEPEMIHWDLWEGNIFVKDGKISGIIDWERAMWAEGLMEQNFRCHAKNPAFLEGYGMEKLTEAQQLRCLWYDVHLYLVMMIEGTYRQYEDDGQYRWAKSVFLPVWEELNAYSSK